MKCLLCDETRGIQDCHIISRQLDYIGRRFVIDGQELEDWNILRLCPSHHWYLDHGILSAKEQEIIDPKIRKALDIFSEILTIWAAEAERKSVIKDTKNIVELVRNIMRHNKTVDRMVIDIKIIPGEVNKTEVIENKEVNLIKCQE